MGVGLTVGEAVVGNVGTAELFNCTAIGDAVNLREQILLNGSAYACVKDSVECRAPPETSDGWRWPPPLPDESCTPLNYLAGAVAVSNFMKFVNAA